MRKMLLGSAALLATALAAGSVQAQLEISVGGYVRFDAGVWDDDIGTRYLDGGDLFEDGPDRSSFDFRSRSQVVVRADGVADNGLRYGAMARITQNAGSTGFSMDETVVYLTGGWGRIEFGDEDGAADTMAILTPGAATGGVFGQWSDWAGWDYDDAEKPIDSSDSTKVIYYTPRFGGIQLGVSYAPFDDADGQGNRVADRRIDRYEDFVELGANYVGSFGAVDLRVGATYSYANAPSGMQDLSAWMVGANVGFGAFTVGGSYVYQGGSMTASGSGVSSSAWSIGATWSQGPWEIGLNYVHADMDGREIDWVGLGDIPTGRAWAAGAGVGYTIAPGLALLTDVVYFNARSSETIDVYDEPGGALVSSSTLRNEGWVGTTRLNVSF